MISTCDNLDVIGNKKNLKWWIIPERPFKHHYFWGFESHLKVYKVMMNIPKTFCIKQLVHIEGNIPVQDICKEAQTAQKSSSN